MKMMMTDDGVMIRDEVFAGIDGIILLH